MPFMNWGFADENYERTEDGSFARQQDFEDAKSKNYFETRVALAANFLYNPETGEEFWPDGTIHK